MATLNLTIGDNCEIISHSTKQAGYGRQHLYVDVFANGKAHRNIYVCDVFPNILEHYQDSYYISQYASYNEETGKYTRDSGCGEYEEDQIFNSINDLLNHALKGQELEIEIPDVYVIAWDENTNTTKYYQSSESNGTTIPEQADKFDFEEDAQKMIDDNDWMNCYVTTSY